MKTLLVFLALSLCAAAQTDDLSGLSGPADNPLLTNQLGKPIEAALLVSTKANGKIAVFRPTLFDAPLQEGFSWAPLGEEHRFTKYGDQASPIIRTVLVAVVLGTASKLSAGPPAGDVNPGVCYSK